MNIIFVEDLAVIEDHMIVTFTDKSTLVMPVAQWGGIQSWALEWGGWLEHQIWEVQQ